MESSVSIRYEGDSDCACVSNKFEISFDDEASRTPTIIYSMNFVMLPTHNVSLCHTYHLHKPTFGVYLIFIHQLYIYRYRCPVLDVSGFEFYSTCTAKWKIYGLTNSLRLIGIQAIGYSGSAMSANANKHRLFSAYFGCHK